MSPEQERVYLAPQWKLMWWKFRKHKLAVISGIVILLMYLSVAICEFLAPYHYTTRNTARSCISSTKAASSAPSSTPIPSASTWRI